MGHRTQPEHDRLAVWQPIARFDLEGVAERVAQVERFAEPRLALVCPHDPGLDSDGARHDLLPVVGTEIGDAVGSRVGDAVGRVVGSRVAKDLNVGPGDHVVSSPESVFDLAGVYPLKMRVAGVLAYADTADDDAIFVDLKTSWVIQGLGHGHQDLARTTDEGVVLKRDKQTVVANAALGRADTDAERAYRAAGGYMS